MAFKHLLIIGLQTCLFQVAFSQYAAAYGPSQHGISGTGKILPGGIAAAVGPPQSPLSPGFGTQSPLGAGYGNNYGYGGSSSYGGSGSGDVAVAGELPVAGSTLVTGQVPVIGGVQFGGSLPAAGVVTVTGSCSCGSPYGY